MAWGHTQSGLRPGGRASPYLASTIQSMNTQPVAIVTAASQGIGAACARRLSKDGFRIALMSRSESIHDVAREVDGLGIQGDLTDPIDINHLVGKTLEHYGRLDSVVVNTGHLPKGPLLELSDENWQDGMNMVLMSVARIARAAVPAMRACGAKGTITCISGAASREVMDEFPVSTVMRSGLTAFVRMAARQWAPDVRVNSVLPGFVDSYEVSPEFMETIPTGRSATTDEIASLVSFLSTSESSYVTGESICIDGGMTKAIR